MYRMTRRQFTSLGTAIAAAGVLQACTSAAPGATPAPAATAAPTSPPATIISQPIQTAVPTVVASPQSAAILPAPTPITQKLDIEFVIERGEGDHYVLSAMENTKQFNAKYPSVNVKISTGVKTEAQKLRLQEHKPAEIGNVAGSAADISNSIDAIKAGYIFNLEDTMKSASWDIPGKSWWDTINPLIQPLLRVPGYPGVWSLPNNVTTLNFYYNKQIFSKASVKPPTTWSELETVAKTLKAANITPFTLDGTAAHGYMNWWLDELVSKMGGNQLNRDVLLGKTKMADHPEFLKAAQMVLDWVDKGYFVNGFAGLDHTGSQMVFYQGQAAMVLVGSWLLGEMRTAIPTDFQQDVFRFPTVEGGKGNPKHIFGTSNTYGIAKESPHPEIGAEWARSYNSLAMTNWRSTNVAHQPAIVGATAPTQTPTLNKIFEESNAIDIFNNGDLMGQMKEHQTTYSDLVGKLFRKDISPEEYVKQQDEQIAAFYKK